MKGFRGIAVASLALAGCLALSGCAAARIGGMSAAAPTRNEETSPGHKARQGGRPFYILSLGRGESPRPVASPVPFSYTEETADRWLVLFELSYPAESTPVGAP
jgi:hypothetical protein